MIGVINVESHKVKFSVLENTDGNVLVESSKLVNLIKPCPGWVEVDPDHIWNALCTIINEVIEQLKIKNLSKNNIDVVGIITERGTVVAWDSESNKPLYNAIHYSDTRTDTNIQNLKSKNESIFNEIEDTSGLRLTSMFSAAKLKWIIDNTNNTKQLTTMRTFKFGTLDTWLVWKLTKGNLYMTDVTNASYTLLMNLKTFEWSTKACDAFNIPISLMPTIQSSSGKYGIIEETALKGILIGSILANHQAALYGLNYKKTGEILSRYEDSCIVSCIVGNEFIKSHNGLLTTVAYKMDNEPAVYALEGWTSIGGKVIEWLKNNMKILESVEEMESLNVNVSDVYFVPAFNGLSAPHWKPNARGIICGMTHYTNKKHIIRAALEAICFHTKDVCVAFEKDTGIFPSQLIVDGAYSIYNNILHYQADILGIDVIRSQMIDMAVYGSAKAAAQVLNIKFENNENSLYVSKPTTTELDQKYRYSKWLKTIRQSSWITEPSLLQEKPKLNKKEVFKF